MLTCLWRLDLLRLEGSGLLELEQSEEQVL